jgi:antitoxin HicB
MTARELINEFEVAGWSLVRVRGSHHIYGKNGHSFPIPKHAGKELGKGLVASARRKLKEVG